MPGKAYTPISRMILSSRRQINIQEHQDVRTTLKKK